MRILSGRARIAGLMGWPVAHSRSPRLHNFWPDRHNIDGAYVPLPVAPVVLGEALRGLVSAGFAGGNVTIPHKEEAARLCDRLTDEARRIGAVNTLVFRDGKIEGRSTDGEGFLANLRAPGVDPAATPTRHRRSLPRARFDRIFHRRTGFATPDRLLQRLHANESELLLVLDRPEIPLHTNGSENDIRCQVTKRHVSDGTKSAAGRNCRDAFLGLAKTCRKLGIAFWTYFGARLDVQACPSAAYFPDLVRCLGDPA